VIPLGSPKKDLALSWIKYSLSDESQAKIADLIPYGPVNKKAIPLVSPETQKLLPSNPDNGFPQDALLPDEDWWAANQEPLTERFESWLAK
jgi:putative spermidine/putrescine transport system substrate-binding protein